MKYILMMNTMKSGHGVPDGLKKDLQAHIAFMMAPQQRTSRVRRIGFSRGAVVSRASQAGPSRQERSPVTDGVFPEVRSFSPGTGSSMSTARSELMRSPRRLPLRPGPGGAPLNMPIEVRPVMSGPPTEYAVTETHDDQSHGIRPLEHLLRELAPQVLGAVARRFRDFSSAEDAVQEAMIAAFTQWPQEGVPENPRGWLIQVASPPHDRPDAQRNCPPRERNGSGCGNGKRDIPPRDRGRHGSRRHSDFVVHVLPSRAHSVLGNRADVAGGWRFDHG